MSEPRSPPAPPHRVFIVADHPLVREWLAKLIDREPDLSVCGQAESSVAAYETIGELRPDVVVVDFWCEGGVGPEVVKRLGGLAPQVPALLLSMHGNMPQGERALRAGARGFVIDHAATGQIIEAIRQVLCGQVYISGLIAVQIAEKYLSARKAGVRSADALLTAREIEVFRLIGLGHKTRIIAEELRLSPKTIQVYCDRIKEKLALADRTELLREAVRWVDGQEARLISGHPGAQAGDRPV